jgi:hypothetical protein
MCKIHCLRLQKSQGEFDLIPSNLDWSPELQIALVMTFIRYYETTR